MVVDTVNRGGQSLTKSFRVFTNDPQQRQAILSINGKVNGYIDVSPSRVRLFGHPGETISQQVRIIPHAEYPFTVQEVKASNGAHIRVAIEPEGKKAPKEGYVLTVTSTRSEAGSFGDHILVKTDLKHKPTIGIPVSGRIYVSQKQGK